MNEIFFFDVRKFSTKNRIHFIILYLLDCICTAWNLTEQELYLMWPKIRNALLQLRRDAIAGKCIRMNSKRRQQQQQQQEPLNHDPCNSEDEDDDNQYKSDLCR